MSNPTKRLTTATALLVSVSLGVLLAVAPAAYAVPACSATAGPDSLGYTYTLSIASCSPSGVPLNFNAIVSASTTNPSVEYVIFHIYNPSHVSVYFSWYKLLSTSYGPNSLNIPGIWRFTAYFYTGTLETVGYVIFDLSVQILVLTELPLGTIAAASVALVGFFAVRRLSRTFSPVVPVG